MHPTLTILDDFLPGDWCEKLRREVLDSGFTTELINESPDHPPTPYYTVNTRIQHREMFDLIGKGLGFGIKPNLQAFRLGEQGSHLHNLVHADHTCSLLAGVFYLNPQDQCRGGTAFWRHRKHGWDRMPTQEELDAAGYTLDELSKDWHDANAWEMLSLAGMKNNRMIIYPSRVFHSRWPWEGFGDSPETARLIWCGFFDIE